MANDGLYNDDFPAGSSQAGPKTSSIQRVRQRHAALKSERSSFEPTWRDISSYIQPRHGRFFVSDVNKGDRKDLAIVNNTATRASRIKAAGIMSGLTNPARPWIRFTTPDPDLNEFEPAQRWLSSYADRTLWAFQRSNVYLALHSLYGDLDYGTAAMHVEEDPEKLLRAYLYPVGSYWLANSYRQRVDTVYREFQMTAAQLVERFGLEKVSKRAADAYRNNRPDHWFTVLHIIEPNRDLQKGQLNKRGKPWVSRWLEQSEDESQGFLREGGYDEFPAMCPRWDVNGEDIYGTGPGHDCIGDAKALQTLERRSAQFGDHLSRPAWQLPSSAKNEPVSLQPGSMNFFETTGPAQAVRPIYEPNPAGMTVLEAKIDKHEKRINQAFGVDVWTMFANDTQGQMTATEVLRRREEKMLLMGPYLMRLDEELLDPLVDRTASILLRSGIMPPPPKELQGMEIRVEYQSVLAQAQRAMGITGVRELVAFTGALAQMQVAAGRPPEALDKIDEDQCIDDFAQMVGTRPELVRSDEKVAARRQARAQAQQEQQQLEQAQKLADVGKTLGDTSTGEDTALQAVLQSVAGERG